MAQKVFSWQGSIISVVCWTVVNFLIFQNIKIVSTVIILNIRTGRSGQDWRSSLIRVYTMFAIPSNCKTTLFKYRVNKAIYFVLHPILWILDFYPYYIKMLINISPGISIFSYEHQALSAEIENQYLQIIKTRYLTIKLLLSKVLTDTSLLSKQNLQ